MKAIVDIETNGLNPDIVWLVGVKDIETGKEWVFERPDLHPDAFLALLSTIDCIIGHHFIGYDHVHLSRLVRGYRFNSRNIIDTLVVSKLLHYRRPKGHSLDVLGRWAGVEKLVYLGDFLTYEPEMEAYLRGDLRTNLAVYNKFKPYIEADWLQEAMRLEHDMAIVCQQMKENGFYFNIIEAKKLEAVLSKKKEKLDRFIAHDFPIKFKPIKQVKVKETKDGNVHKGNLRTILAAPHVSIDSFDVGAEFTLIENAPFNPGSPKQVVERLNEFGWKPIEKTKGHIAATRKKDYKKLAEYAKTGWKINETNLSTLPDTAPPAAHKLRDWLIVAARLRTLTEWFGAYNSDTHRIHGNFNPIGTWTHRMSHDHPNMGNTPGDKAKYGKELRALYCAAPGKVLVGTDAEGIQLRVLAHYMNDDAFTKALVEGDKKMGTDAHSLNAKALGFSPTDIAFDHDTGRDVAKTYIYAWILYAGLNKQAEILRSSQKVAKAREKSFISQFPGLKKVKEELVPKLFRQGWFEAIDGRKIVAPSEHKVLAGLLQSGEKIIMARARLIWGKKLKEMRIPFWHVNLVHDEFQTETFPEFMHIVGDVQCEAIQQAGEYYDLRCPHAGEYSIGRNWTETH